MPDDDANGEAEQSASFLSLKEQFPLACNVPDEILYANMRSAMERDIPVLDSSDPHDGIAAIVGGGPSLADDIETIRALQNSGCHLFALNNAAHFLARHGIVADALVVLDARPHNARFVKGLDPRTHIYIASQCAPETFDAVTEGAQVTMWHAPMGGKSGVREYRKTFPIGFGTVVGVRAELMVYVIGYRSIHLFAMDSSYRDGKKHAYPQPENDNDRPVECSTGLRKFISSPSMIRQAYDLYDLTVFLINKGANIGIHGDGLFPAMMRDLMTINRAPVAVYDMAKAPASWDFVVWLAAAEMDRIVREVDGPLKVVFKPGPKDGFRDDGLPLDTMQRQQMLDCVMRPALDLFGAVEVQAEDGLCYPYTLRQVSEAARAGHRVPQVDVPRWACADVSRVLRRKRLTNPVVITLREASHWPSRNSNIEAWLEFAHDLKRQGEHVIFVRDTEKADEALEGFTIMPRASRDVRIRAALYEQAKCNMMVFNGPATLAYFGSRPFLIFKPLVENYNPGTAEWWREHVGVELGQQYPWATPDQRIVWGNDSIANLRAAWRNWRRMRTPAIEEMAS